MPKRLRMKVPEFARFGPVPTHRLAIIPRLVSGSGNVTVGWGTTTPLMVAPVPLSDSEYPIEKLGYKYA